MLQAFGSTAVQFVAALTSKEHCTSAGLTRTWLCSDEYRARLGGGAAPDFNAKARDINWRHEILCVPYPPGPQQANIYDCGMHMFVCLEARVRDFGPRRINLEKSTSSAESALLQLAKVLNDNSVGSLNHPH